MKNKYLFFQGDENWLTHIVCINKKRYVYVVEAGISDTWEIETDEDILSVDYKEVSEKYLLLRGLPIYEE